MFNPQMVHSPNGCKGRIGADRKLGASSGFPRKVQGPKAFGQAPLLSQATNDFIAQWGQKQSGSRVNLCEQVVLHKTANDLRQ